MSSQKFSVRNQGFTLIEVMVAVFIMAIGLLGLASLHGIALKHNNNAYYRTIAAQMATQMAEGMRANRDFAAAYTAPFTIEDDDSDNSGESESDDASDLSALDFSCVASEPCDAPTFIDYEIRAWLKSLSFQLPGGTGSITRDEASNLVAVTVSWLERVDTELEGEMKNHTLLVNL